MSYSIKSNLLVCDHCGQFMKRFYDSYTPFGCANPSDPEPYDPTDMCKNCSKKDEKKWLDWFKKGFRSGNWMKSKSEQRAAKKMGLVWIHSEGITLNGKSIAYQYVNREDRKEERGK